MKNCTKSHNLNCYLLLRHRKSIFLKLDLNQNKQIQVQMQGPYSIFLAGKTASPPQWQPHHCYAASAAAALYFSKFMLVLSGGRHLVDIIGDFSWTKGVTSRGHFCPREVLFLGEFSWTFFG